MSVDSVLADPLAVEPLHIVAGGSSFRMTVPIPGSKSITNRALVCAALADGPSVLTGVLASDDTDAMVEGLRAFGIGVDAGPEGAADQLTVWGCLGRLPNSTAHIDARMSGTTSRFLLPVSALATGPVVVDGSPSLRARPMADGIAALQQMGLLVRSENGHLPVTVQRDPDESFEPGRVTVRGDVSSQFLSGLLLVAPCLPYGLEIEVDGLLQSVPYVDMTVAVMASFGALVDIGDDHRSFSVQPTGYQHRSYGIEPDASAASYFFAAAALCGGTVTVDGLGTDSLQGDAGFCGVLERCGAAVECSATSTTVTGTGRLLGGTFDMALISDTAQTLAAIAPFAESPIEITGIGFIRRKETDRIAAVVTELGRCGVTAIELDDGLRVEPGVVGPAVIETYDDHRMAMSFAVLGLRAPGIEIADPGCVAKTFPRFWDVVNLLREAKP